MVVLLEDYATTSQQSPTAAKAKTQPPKQPGW